jgi:hypothetical protein
MFISVYCFIIKGDIAQLTSLMMSGVEVNIRTYDLRSALHLAGYFVLRGFCSCFFVSLNRTIFSSTTFIPAAEGQLATVKFLLEKGADVNATDR